MNETYHVSGTLEHELGREVFGLRHFSREVEAPTAQAAADSFEIGGWEWVEPPTVWLVSEAMKLERAGQPSLFPLPEKWEK